MSLKLFINNNLICSLAVILVLAANCNNPEQSPDNGLRDRKDMLGRTVGVPEKVNKVVAIGPGALRLLCYLQVTEKVTGIEELERRSGRPYAFAYPELQNKPLIGPPFTGDAELIASCKPDIIVKTYTSQREADKLQNKTNIPVVAIQYTSKRDEWKTLKKSLSFLGEVFNKQSRADSLIAFFSSSIDTLKLLTSKADAKPKVYAGGISHRGTHGFTSTSIYYEPFEFVSARNVASPLREKYDSMEEVIIDPEQILKWNPEIIFLDLAGIQLIRKDIQKYGKLLDNTTAFKNSQVYGIHPYNWYAVNYATTLINAWYIGSVLYPEQFSKFDIEKKADEIYTQFLGKNVYQEMTEQYGPYQLISKTSLTENTTKKQE
ncbi:MAG: iron ABC transporter substrate-binding protein [Bacteroidales bacterium]